MTFVTRIGEYFQNQFPDPQEVQHYFKDYTNQKWQSGNGWLVVYGAYGTERETPGKGRVDLWLSIAPDVKYGFYLHYSKVGAPPKEVYHSLGNESLLGPDCEMIEIDDNGYCVAAGLFVPPADAWEVVRYFIETQGERSDAIRWFNDDDLPAWAIDAPFSE